MSIDKQKLQPLLWSVVGAFSQGDQDLQKRMDALDEFFGKTTVEEVALGLLVECESLRKDAERYRGVRRVANRQGFTDEQFDRQTDTRTASFDAAMAKEASHG